MKVFGCDSAKKEEEECDEVFDDCDTDCLSINEIDDKIFNRLEKTFE